MKGKNDMKGQSNMKGSLMKTMRGSFWLQFLALLVMFPSLVMMPNIARANPSGGVVSAGVAEILANELDPAFLQIIQSSDKAIINWQDFSISAGETTQFIQPSQMSAVLNRVISGNPSLIAGMLSANGKVIVVNQNGIVVTSSGVIDAAGGVVLSTLDIADGDFMNGMDDSFLGTTAAGVTNYGTIMSAGGDVILLGNFVDNAGIIGAPDGVVALGAGGNIVVHAQGESKISITGAGVGADTGVNNSGTITGAAAELKAHGNVYALAINNSGMIRASGSQTINGRVLLTSRSADGETGGNIENSGEIRANNADGSGGFVMIDGGPGSSVGILDGGRVSVNGINDTAGGDVVMIGQSINIAQGAEVTANGSEGGTILIGSVEDTQAVTIGGKVSANGSIGNGGTVMVIGDSSSVLSVTSTGSIEATGAVNGGLVSMQGGTINAAFGSTIDVGGGVDGGTVAIIGEDANGAVNLNGAINAAGGTGAGGVITATGAGNVNVGANAVMNADGASGGLVSIDGAADTTMEGTITALGNVEQGGTANVTGQNVVVAVQATMDVSGLTGGGQINVGGGFQGNDENLRNSESTVVGGLATLKADAINTGDAGKIVIWSDGDTIFGGEISAQAKGQLGRGGFVEVSGKRTLRVAGGIVVSSQSGERGLVLFDPGDINVGDNTSDLEIATVNGLLQMNTDVIIATQSGDIIFDSLGLALNTVNASVQWNTDASLGIFASGDVRFNNNVRTAGAGSISVIAGWTGFEADLAILANDPEAAWNYYVNGAAAGSFGGGPGGISGNVYINDPGNNRAVEVGSRYGNTNVAASSIILSGATTGNWRQARLGFRDTGAVFALSDPEMRLGTDADVARYVGGELMVDVNDVAVLLVDGITQATYSAGDPILSISGEASGGFYAGGELVLDSLGNPVVDHDGNPLVYAAGTPILDSYGNSTIINHAAHDNDPLIALVGVNEVTVNGQVGVRMFDSTGVRSDTFLPYADDFNREFYGNWWWRGLNGNGTNGGSSGIGNNLPEMGAGVSQDLVDKGGAFGNAIASADINIEARGAVVLRAADSRTGSYAAIGHGAFSLGTWDRSWNRNDDVPNAGGGGVNDGEGIAGTGVSVGGTPLTTAGGFDRRFAFNWANSENRSSQSIARLVEVYGDINIRTGLTEDPITNNLEATGLAGAVSLQAGQTSTGGQKFAQIGHLGPGQAGTVNGNINVEAGGQVSLLGGPDEDGFAVIGNVITRGQTGEDWRMGIGVMDDGDGVVGAGDTGWSLNSFGGYSLGGGLQKQFRYFRRPDDFNDATQRMGDLATVIPDQGLGSDPTGLYDGTQVVTGRGAGVTSNLNGDISVTSAAGGVELRGFATGGVNTDAWSSGAFVQIGNGGSPEGIRRLNASGNITVEANGVGADISVIAGFAPTSYAQIGNGGWSFGAQGDNGAFDSNYLMGDITVSANGDLVVEGGGRVLAANVENIRRGARSNYAMIGNGGANARTAYKAGDITVTVGGDLRVTGGALGSNFAQIGNGGDGSYGQIGGDFTRDINIPDVNGVDQLVNTTIIGETANIVVTVAGDILLDHLDPLTPATTGADTQDLDLNDAYTLIGNGGSGTTRDVGNVNGLSYDYWDKTGDVTVTAGGSLTMESGGGKDGWYTRIGAGATDWDRQSNDREALFSGDVTVNVGTDLIMNANAADSVYGTLNGDGVPSEFVASNPVAIGNGGTRNGMRINFDGDVTVTVGGNLEMQSGKGFDASYAQIGNGGAGSADTSGNANDVGEFTGDVTVDVGGSLTMTANPEGIVFMINPTAPANYGEEVESSYVLIGNGGALWRTNADDTATADGDVRVTVGMDLTMTAVNRQQGQSPTNQDGANNDIWAAPINNFVQIGNANAGNNTLGTANGDVYVEVGNDLTMTGGRGEIDADMEANLGAYAQIGNGGAQMDGQITGDIEVKVGNNLTTNDGDGVHDNYVKIGNGDWMRDTPLRSGTGDRAGDIIVNVGNTASFDRTLVGHRDPLVSNNIVDSGDTFIGVSRNDPFTGGPGQLIAMNESVFTSGGAGLLGTQLRFYMPARANNQLSLDTRLNSAAVTFVGADTNFQAPTLGAVRGIQAGFQREDELYLQPDWWSDANGQGGSPFPGGSVAEVSGVGGFANLVSAPAGGSLGDGTGVNAQGDLTYLTPIENTLGNYTLYYDAIENVAPMVPGGGGGAIGGGGGFAPPVVPPVVIPPFIPDVDLFSFLFFNQSGADLFGYTERDDLIMGDVVDGGGDTQEGLDPQKPRSFFGVADRELTPEEEEDERRRRARYQYQVSNGGRIFWIYDVNSRQYSSARLFGTPSGPSVSP